MRAEEMVFLGMSRRPQTAVERSRGPLEKMKKIQRDRKLIQEKLLEELETAKEELKEEILENEGPDIKETMLKERRDWIQEFRSLHAKKPPDDLKEFYNRFKVEKPLTAEEQEEQRLKEEEEAKQKKKKKETKKKAKKKKKGAGDGDDDKKKILKIGPSEVVQKFDEFYTDYNDAWANKDETDNFE